MTYIASPHALQDVACHPARHCAGFMPWRGMPAWCGAWLRTNGVNTNRAAAKVMDFDRLGEKVRPGTFDKINVG